MYTNTTKESVNTTTKTHNFKLSFFSLRGLLLLHFGFCASVGSNSSKLFGEGTGAARRLQNFHALVTYTTLFLYLQFEFSTSPLKIAMCILQRTILTKHLKQELFEDHDIFNLLFTK